MPMLPLVGVDTLQHSKLAQIEHVLLVCLQEDAWDDVEDMVERAGQAFDDQLTIWMVDETALSEVMTRFVVQGTPTFLLLQRGVEKARLLGKMQVQDLELFLSRHVPMPHALHETAALETMQMERSE